MRDSTCKLTVVDDKLEPIFNNIITINNEGGYKVSINKSLFSYGAYSYIAICNRTNQAGYVRSTFFLNYDGNEPPDAMTAIVLVIFIPLFLALLSMLVIFSLGDLHIPLKIFMIILSFISISVSYNYIIKIVLRYYNPVIAEFIAIDYGWYAWVIYIVIIYFILYWIKTIFNYLQGEKENELRFDYGKK